MELNLSRKVLSTIMECSTSYINAIENDYRTSIQIDYALKLFKTLNIYCDVSKLIKQ